MIRRVPGRAALVAILAAGAAPPTTASAQRAVPPPGEEATARVVPGDTVVWTVDRGARWFVLGEVDQRSADVQVRVVTPDGRTVGTVEGPARGPERFHFETSEPGAYRIEVTPTGDERGEVALRLHRLEPLAAEPAELVDQLLSPYDGEDTPGAAVAVFRDGRTLLERGYGMADLTWGVPFEPDTRTNIGSTSKQFTAFAVMLLRERGLLDLDDDVREYVPEVPDFGETITIRHLLTHTSGLREFLNLLALGGRRLDHGDWIDRSELLDVVARQPALQNAPGAEWNYNNTAFGLAALVVERVSGRAFHEFMADEVFGPLGMARTMVRPSPQHVVPESSEGYLPGEDGGWIESGDLGGAVGAGGIYSTVQDLERWVTNFWEMRRGSAATFREMTTSYVLADGDTTGYGLGVSVGEQRGLRRIQHGGADVAHRSMLVYYPEIRAGVTVQSNNATFPSSVAFRIGEAFFGEHMDPEPIVAEDAGELGVVEFDPAAYDPDAFDELAGRYELDAAPGFVLTLSREGGTYHLQATGQPRIEIRPTSDTTFTLLGVDADVVFHRDADGRVDALTLNQGGPQRATRLDGEAEAWSPDADALEAFTGRYFSDEIETFYEVVLREGSLLLRHRRLDDVTLRPGERDTFTGGSLAGPITVSFERDRAGSVIAFYVDNVRTRDVRFRKMR